MKPMQKFIFAGMACLFLVSARAESFQVVELNVRLFGQHSGDLAPALKGNEVLWNVVTMGVNSDPKSEPVSAALVDVVVRGSAKANKANGLRLVVKNGKTGVTLKRQQASIGIPDSNGKTHVGFWLADIGCQPLTIIASTSHSSKTTNVPFACGE